MTLLPSTARRRPAPRPARLTVQPLEDRATPATAVYSALTQTLTVVAADGDRFDIARLANESTGYLKVTELQNNATVFNSDTTHQGVRNVVVRFGAANSGGLILDANVRIGGNLTVVGARTAQTLDLFGTVGGNFSYTAASGAAFDDLRVGATAQIGGNMTLAAGGGENTIRFEGGTVRGNLAMSSGAGIDRVELNALDDLNVGGSASMNLGAGNNTVVGINAHLIRVGTNFTYTGGAGNDTFDLDGSGSTLQVGQDARFTLGIPTAFDANLATFESLNAGRNVFFTGGAGADTILFSGGMLIGGSVTASLGAGTNSVDSNQLGSGVNSIGGNFAYTGGAGGDAVSLDGTSIGRDVTVALGESGGAAQAFNSGTKSPAGVTIFGTLTVTGGNGADAVALHRTYIGNSLVLNTGGGADGIGIDDVDVAGATSIDLGAGNDLLLIEMAAADSGGPLATPTTFGGTVTVRGGDGDDTVSLSSDLVPDPTTLIHFGGRVALIGGAGADTMANAAENIFEVTNNSNDFETHAGTAMP